MVQDETPFLKAIRISRSICSLLGGTIKTEIEVGIPIIFLGPSLEESLYLLYEFFYYKVEAQYLDQFDHFVVFSLYLQYTTLTLTSISICFNTMNIFLGKLKISATQ